MSYPCCLTLLLLSDSPSSVLLRLLPPLQVCDVLWCMTHKVAGSFADVAPDFQCREFTNIDVYRLGFFDTTSPRPAICQQYDPVSCG